MLWGHWSQYVGWRIPWCGSKWCYFLEYTDRSTVTRLGTKAKEDFFIMSSSYRLHAVFICFVPNMGKPYSVWDVSRSCKLVSIHSRFLSHWGIEITSSCGSSSMANLIIFQCSITQRISCKSLFLKPTVCILSRNFSRWISPSWHLIRRTEGFSKWLKCSRRFSRFINCSRKHTPTEYTNDHFSSSDGGCMTRQY